MTVTRHKQKIHEVLKAARVVIAEPHKWTKYAYARDASGAHTTIGHRGAVCFCAVGAVARATEQAPMVYPSAVFEALSAKIPAKFLEITDFNDDPGTTHADVLNLFDEAIESTKP